MNRRNFISVLASIPVVGWLLKGNQCGPFEGKVTKLTKAYRNPDEAVIAGEDLKRGDLVYIKDSKAFSASGPVKPASKFVPLLHRKALENAPKIIYPIPDGTHNFG